MKQLQSTMILVKLFAGVIVCAAAFPVQIVQAAEFKITPSVSLSEEFNDNVRNSASERKSDFITRVQPGVGLFARAPRLTSDLSYSFDYHNYARGTQGNEENHYLNFKASAELLKNFFFLDVSDTLSRVSLDVTRDVTTESLFANQTDQNRATVSPYFLWRLGEKKTLKTGYRFTDTSYWGLPGVDKREHRAFADISYDPTDRLNLNGGYAWGRTASDRVDYDQHDASVMFRYEYAERSTIFGGIGNSWQLPSVGSNTSNLFWNAGLSRDFGNLLATAETRVQYTEDPLAVSTKETSYRLSLEKGLEHGTVGVSAAYRKYLGTLDGGNDRRKAEIGGFWRGELTPRLNASLTVVGDKVSKITLEDYPYRLSGGAGVTYLFTNDVSTTLSYSHVAYRRELSGADTGDKRTNRLLLEARRAF